MEALIRAIQEKKRVRIVYRRKADEVVSVHEVAPIDLRGGWTSRTANTLYLWAWCFAEDRLEMHLMDRLARVIPLETTFDPLAILARWPVQKWPIPESWTVPRDWDTG